MSISAPLQRKSILALLILTAGFLIWMPRQQKLARMQQARNASQAQYLQASQAITNFTQELELRRRASHQQTEARDLARASAAGAEQLLAGTHPDAYWSQPPDSWPDWNTNSPFVWMHKSILPQLGVECFTEQGQLKSDVAQVLTIPKDQLAELNEKLSKLIADFRSDEALRAYRTNSPSETLQTGARKLTIRIDAMADEGQQLAKDFEAALDALGQQRSEYLMKSFRSELERHYSDIGKQPQTISVERRPDGTTQVVITHDGWLGTQVITTPANQPLDSSIYPIPPHLRPLFSELWDTPSPNPQPMPE